jgi:hypothetical protein
MGMIADQFVECLVNYLYAAAGRTKPFWWY